MIDEDLEWASEMDKMKFTMKELKKQEREVLAEDWEEDMSVFAHKRRERK